MPISKEDFESEDLSREATLPIAAQTFARIGLQKCAVCRHPKRSDFERDYFEKRSTAKAIATDIHISEDQVQAHMKLHVRHEIQERTPSEFVERMASELPAVLTKLETMADKMYVKAERILDIESIDPATVMAMKNFSSEFREYVKLIAQLKGQITTAPTVNVGQMNVQYNDLKMAILTKLCPVCRQKVIEALERPGTKKIEEC